MRLRLEPVPGSLSLSKLLSKVAIDTSPESLMLLAWDSLDSVCDCGELWGDWYEVVRSYVGIVES